MTGAPAAGERTRRRRLRGPLVTVVWLVGVGWAGLLGVLRSADPSASRAVELVAFTPTGVFTAAAALAAVALVTSRMRRLSMAAVAAALLVLHLSWAAPLYTGAAPTADPQCRVTVLTQNLEVGDAADLAARVRAERVDVLVVVESTRRGIGNAVAEIERDLPYVEGISPSRWSNAVIFSRHPIHDVGTSADGRSTAARVDGSCLGPVDIVAVHPAPPYGANQWRRDYEQVEAFVAARLASEQAATGGRAIVLGDLNATLDHAPVRRLLDLGLRDSAELVNAGWLPTYPAPGSTRRWRLPVPALVPIDRILLGGALTASEVRTVQIAGADHLAMLAAVHPVREAPG